MSVSKNLVETVGSRSKCNNVTICHQCCNNSLQDGIKVRNEKVQQCLTLNFICTECLRNATNILGYTLSHVYGSYTECVTDLD